VLIDDYMRDITPKAQIKSCIALSQAFLLRGMLSYILGDYAAASADAAAIYYSMTAYVRASRYREWSPRSCSKAEYMRGDLATAKEDLRACCAYKCELGEELFKTNEVRWLLGVMATEKAGTPRPHYSDHERHEICRALQLEHKSSKCITCAVCQQPPSADVRLKLCKQCQQRWYCSRECQKRHWPEHKRGCSPILPNMQVIIMHTVEAKYKAAIDARGFAFTEHKNAGTQALCVDPATDDVFQSIKDQDITFYNPNAGGNPLAGPSLGAMMLGNLLGAGRQRRDGAMSSKGPVVGMQHPDPHIIYPDGIEFGSGPDC